MPGGRLALLPVNYATDCDWSIA